MKIDLHLHSCYSDGRYEPDEVIRLAHKAGLKTVALTDHDNTAGNDKAVQAAKELGLEFIPGIELHLENPPAKETHMLGYYVCGQQPFVDIYKTIENIYKPYVLELIKGICQIKGEIIDLPAYEKRFHGMYSRGSLGIFMYESGLLSESGKIRDIVKLLEQKGLLAKRPPMGVLPETGIQAIHKAGGLAVLAHPGRMGLDNEATYKCLVDYKNKGLDGVEVYHPSHSADYKKLILSYAKRLDLLVTGGSDFHGNRDDYTIGKNRKVSTWAVPPRVGQKIVDNLVKSKV